MSLLGDLEKLGKLGFDPSLNATKDEKSTFVEDLPFFDEPERKLYAVQGELPNFDQIEGYYKGLYPAEHKKLGRHELVDEYTFRGDQMLDMKRDVPSPQSRGLIPLLPTSPADLALETIMSGAMEAAGPGGAVGVGLGLYGGMRGGKYAKAVGGQVAKYGEPLIKNSIEGLEYAGKEIGKGIDVADEVLGHELSKYRYKKAFGKVQEDPMFSHIDFKTTSKFESSGAPYENTGGFKYGARYTPYEGQQMFGEMFPGGPGWRSNPSKTRPNIKGYDLLVGVGKTDWKGGTKFMGTPSGKYRPFTFRTHKLSEQPRKGLHEGVTRHEGRHFMQDYPTTPTKSHDIWTETIDGKPLYNVTRLYSDRSFQPQTFKTLFDIRVPKEIKMGEDIMDTREIPLRT